MSHRAAAGRGLTSTPDVSVIIPVRNGGRFLEAALASVVAQAGVSFEIVCVDDGSTDDTWSTLIRFAHQHSNVQVQPARGQGISDALNQALAAASGRYVARMDADDICLPGRLATQAWYLDAHPGIGVLGTQAKVIDPSGAVCGRLRVPVGPARIKEALATSSPLIHPTVMMRRELVLAVGGYRNLFDGAEDYDLWLRLAPQVEFENLPWPLLLYRRHHAQQTIGRSFRQARLAALAVVAYRLRRCRAQDPLAQVTHVSQWRRAFAAVDPGSVEEVRQLTASCLADNGGTLRAAGAAYLSLACKSVGTSADEHVRRRLALACVRHELQLLRSRRPLAALRIVSEDIRRWPRAMLGAYWSHASILWRAAPPNWPVRHRRPGRITTPRAEGRRLRALV
ncbi:MAG: glycosyltransferase [Acetobacteraceae bacterium]|nr:glycosyltransferase [Acetobacteraceae bacterium]